MSQDAQGFCIDWWLALSHLCLYSMAFFLQYSASCCGEVKLGTASPFMAAAGQGQWSGQLGVGGGPTQCY